MRVGILASHPIQYHAPWFRALAKEVELHVFFAHRQTPAQQSEAGFGVRFNWDVDLLSGYKHTFLKNVSRRPGTNSYGGCDTPEIAEIIEEKIEDTRSKMEGGEPSRSSNFYLPSTAQRRFDAFIVTGWNLKSYWQAIRACRKANIPVLVRGDSQLDTTRCLVKRTMKQLTHRFALRQFDGFLSVGQRNREYLLHYGVPAEKIFFTPHFVDNEFFALQAKKLEDRRSQIRKEWNIPQDAFVPLFVGKFIPKKRPMDLIKAVQILLSSNSHLPSPAAARQLHLLFVGSGKLGAELRANCNVVFDAETPSSNFNLPTSKTKPPASFAGFLNQSEIAKAYVAADVLVLPSDSGETWGLVVNEAMACGLPAIVSSAAGCAPDLIEAGRTGFEFALGDEAELAERIARLLQIKLDGHDFAPALAAKMQVYRVEMAIKSTLSALQTLQEVSH